MVATTEQSAQVNPVFFGGTVSEHVMFVVALCRFQHHSLALSAIHYLTWSVVHVALYAIALALFGPTGAWVLGASLVAWAMRMDVRVGLLFGLLELLYVAAANGLVAALPAPALATVAYAIGALIGALMLELASHLLVQGYPPGPPARAVAGLSVRQKLAFLPYFVVTFGLFFLTLDLAMRFGGHRSVQHRRVNAIAAQWHQDAFDRARGASKSRELMWHRRAVAELS
jgi:hypothetical protein